MSAKKRHSFPAPGVEEERAATLSIADIRERSKSGSCRNARSTCWFLANWVSQRHSRQRFRRLEKLRVQGLDHKADRLRRHERNQSDQSRSRWRCGKQGGGGWIDRRCQVSLVAAATAPICESRPAMAAMRRPRSLAAPGQRAESWRWGHGVRAASGTPTSTGTTDPSEFG
jgi:hypothetical protein